MPPRHELSDVAPMLLGLAVTLTAWTAAGPARAMAAAPGASTSEEVARSPQEQRRRKLLEEMGLRKRDDPTPPAPAPSPSAPDDAPGAAPQKRMDARTAGPKAGTAQSSRPAGGPSFRRVIHPLLVQTCKACHVAGGPAATSSFVLSGDAAPDHRAVMRVVDLHAPAASIALAKASGQKPHGGGAPWPTGGAEYSRVLAWITAGARLDGAAAAGDGAATPVAAGAPPVSSRRSSPLASSPSSPRAIDAAPRSKSPRRLTSPLSRGQPVDAEAAHPELAGDADVIPPAPILPSTQADGAKPGGADVATRAVAATVVVDFAGEVRPLLVHRCGKCHVRGGLAAATRLILSDDIEADYAGMFALVDRGAPARSLLLTKSTGAAHAGGAVIVAGSPDYLLLSSWVASGAARQAAGPAVARSSPGPAAPGTIVAAPTPPARPASPAAPVPLAPPVSQPVDGSPGFPYGIAINGRFDVVYERRGFSGDPTDGAAVDALRSYHHFLFLSRESTTDPIGLAVEMLTLQFWEAHYRWAARELPIQVVVAAGKLLVPFGAEPLMHQSYGGLAGFDQRILPTIWAQTGLVVRALAHRGELAITDDLFLVRGYALKQADAIINLQNDFSPEDDVRIGWGNRVGAAWGPLSGWYSAYYNRLGFGRRLVMQAGDLMLWRIRQVPVLGHFSFAAGLLRADVSGGGDAGTGGPGKDYYHFGSYFQVRYHPTDWLYLQYRQGLRTFNNRRGFIVDDTRLTRDDGSTHNFGAVARWHGLSAGLYYFINLEKVDEIPDDFLRASLTYDF